MSAHSRFGCPSAPLTLKALLKRTQRTLCIGLALAVAVHAALTRLRVLTQEQKTVKPLTTQFIKRQPRLSKPLESKKRPKPRRRNVQREMVAVRAKMQRGDAGETFQPTRVVGRLARPSVCFRRRADLGSPGFDPMSTASPIGSSKEAEQKIDMSLELLDVEALDTGRHHALVIQELADRRSIRGFCHLAIVFSRALYPRGAGDHLSFDRYILPGFLRLVEAMNRYTDIQTEMLGRVALDDGKILKAPWLLFGTHDRLNRPSTTELENLGTYLRSGGFVFADCWNYLSGGTAGYLSLRDILLSALATQGVTSGIEVVPNSHAVYHCYFDFDGPPIANDGADKHNHPEVQILPYLEGIQIEGRVAALLSGKLMYRGWAFGQGGATKDLDPTRPLQFGVNTVVFALTQEGGITHQLMESVR